MRDLPPAANRCRHATDAATNAAPLLPTRRRLSALIYRRRRHADAAGFAAQTAAAMSRAPCRCRAAYAAAHFIALPRFA